MNTRLVPLLSGAALAVMACAGATHYISTSRTVSQAKLNHAPSEDASALIAAIEQQNQELTKSLASKRSALEASSSRQASAPTSPTLLSNSGDADLKRLLAELVAQNQDLRNQLAETNRDLMAVEFRIESFSDDFRPLDTSPEHDSPSYNGNYLSNDQDPYDTSIGVLPPLDIP